MMDARTDYQNRFPDDFFQVEDDWIPILDGYTAIYDKLISAGRGRDIPWEQAVIKDNENFALKPIPVRARNKNIGPIG